MIVMSSSSPFEIDVVFVFFLPGAVAKQRLALPGTAHLARSTSPLHQAPCTLRADCVYLCGSKVGT